MMLPRALVLLGVLTITFVPLLARGDTTHKHEHAPRRIDIAITKDGFQPNGITVKKGEDVVLVFTRKTDTTCAKEIVVYVADDKKVERKLPLDQPVEVAVKFDRTGELGYTCSMGHVAGVIRVQ
jgi:plastocyanin domain-containing protein